MHNARCVCNRVQHDSVGGAVVVGQRDHTIQAVCTPRRVVNAILPHVNEFKSWHVIISVGGTISISKGYIYVSHSRAADLTHSTLLSDSPAGQRTIFS